MSIVIFILVLMRVVALIASIYYTIMKRRATSDNIRINKAALAEFSMSILLLLSSCSFLLSLQSFIAKNGISTYFYFVSFIHLMFFVVSIVLWKDGLKLLKQIK